jgi:alkaline phosphatase D
MKRLFILSLSIILLLSSCERLITNKFVSRWEKSPDRVWAGPDYWANRLQDWSVRSGRLECLSEKPMRTVHLVTRNISKNRGNINTSVNIFLRESDKADPDAAAGFLIGAGRGLDYLAASLIFHSWGELAGIFIGLDTRGNLFIRDFEKENYFYVYDKKNNITWKEAQVIVTISPEDDNYAIRILAINPFTNIVIDKIEYNGIPQERIQGNIALAAHAGYGKQKSAGFSFSEWKVSGTKIGRNNEGNIGPVITAQYTLSRNTLKITAQLMPLGENDNEEVLLEMKEGEKWVQESSTKILKPSYTAHFRINDWTVKENTEYRIAYKLKSAKNNIFYLNGVIKHDPVEKEEIKMLSLSCIQQIIKPDRNKWSGIDGGYFPYSRAILYPHNLLVTNLKKVDADILYFAGDQVYEGASPTAADFGPNAGLDYLYKWYLWCLTYRDLTTCIPAITIPDDHDVYHGNLWGAGGKATPEGKTGAEAQDAGGYKMPAEFVNMVQATQTSHLPDPFDPRPVAQGIGVYYTECNIGGISMAVLEDRKFKSAPGELLPDAMISNGWPLNKNWSTRYDSRIDNAVLLGERQLSFLEQWAGDWSNQTWMKVALSQTLFSNLATLPRDSMDDNAVPVMPIPDSGAYIDGDKLATDFDSDGWPQIERDKAIKLFRKAFATHIVGDQHLGSTVQYGVDDFRDAGYAIVSPATGNIWPRHWFPPAEGKNRKPEWPKNYGDFEDGFGNKLTVFAVANPHKTEMEPTAHNELSTGFSLIKFNRLTHDIELANWPYYADPEKDKPFPFWPVRISQLDNYGKLTTGWLPEVKVEGITNPVIKIYREFTGELVYSLRIAGSSFQPKVFEMGNYRIEIGEPDQDKWQKFGQIYPTEFKEREPLVVKF